MAIKRALYKKDFKPMHAIDKPTERFNFSYLPAPVATSFKDALGCYRNGLMQAFATMCRLTIQAIFNDLGEGAKLKIFDQVEEIANLANIDDRVHRDIRNILFDTDPASLYHPDGIDRETTAILLETMKDILYQAYIRRALLRQKLRMRRFFATQADELQEAATRDPKVAAFKRPTGTG